MTGDRMRPRKRQAFGFRSTGTDQGDLNTIRSAQNIDDGVGGRVTKMKKGGKICPEGKAWAKRTFDKYPSAYANLAASKYCKDPNYAKKSKGGKRKGK
tara:strand:+ start:378 stop:671 length:294 start_codon:yes stop_codon:yes gene_type:complete